MRKRAQLQLEESTKTDTVISQRTQPNRLTHLKKPIIMFISSQNGRYNRGVS